MHRYPAEFHRPKGEGQPWGAEGERTQIEVLQLQETIQPRRVLRVSNYLLDDCGWRSESKESSSPSVPFHSKLSQMHFWDDSSWSSCKQLLHEMREVHLWLMYVTGGWWTSHFNLPPGWRDYSSGISSSLVNSSPRTYECCQSWSFPHAKVPRLSWFRTANLWCYLGLGAGQNSHLGRPQVTSTRSHWWWEGDSP